MGGVAAAVNFGLGPGASAGGSGMVSRTLRSAGPGDHAALSQALEHPGQGSPGQLAQIGLLTVAVRATPTGGIAQL